MYMYKQLLPRYYLLPPKHENMLQNQSIYPNI